MARNEPIETTKLRYVLYARKSTQDENRQVRSINDQIRDCKKRAADLGLHIVGEPIRENQSAKKPGKRPKFIQMIKDIEAGKYDAILCWHPDRLCRNMLEGGQIINMLDEGTLKDICFYSHQFSNDANGKMLLGMLFVFSKQYSDDLSDKVNRGISGNLDEGRSSGTPKIGYTRSEITGLYEPNDFYDTVREAWDNRLEGDSLDTITKFLLDRGVHRLTKNPKNQRALYPTKSTVSNMFRDPFYYGVLIQSGQETDLTKITNFQPMITKDEYEQVQAFGYGRTRDRSKMKRSTFYPLHGFVYCAVCNSPKYTVVGKNKTGSGKYVLSYRCDNKACTRSPRSLRAKHIFESIYNKLEGIKLSDEAYERYSNQIDHYTDDKIDAIKKTIHSKRGILSHIRGEINDRSLALGRLNPSSPAYKPNKDKLENLAIEQADLQVEIKDLESKVANPNRIKLNKEEFLNLVKRSADKMRAGSAVEKDILCRIFFLNLRIDNEEVVDFIWNEPFASLVKAIEFQVGGDGWT